MASDIGLLTFQERTSITQLGSKMRNFTMTSTAPDSFDTDTFNNEYPVVPGLDEDLLGVTYHTDVYDYIEPEPHYKNKTFKGCSVFIAGASRGIGAETALAFARSGAHVALSSRNLKALEEVKSQICGEVGDAKIITLVADVTKPADVKAALDITAKKFGKIDIIVANAGKAGLWTNPFLDKDPDDWWDTVEVNLRGAYNVIYYSIAHIKGSEGYLFVISSRGAQLRIPGGSDYCSAKLAVQRLVEIVYFEHPDLKIMALHPGSIPTEMGSSTKFGPPPVDTVQLPAATMLYLAAGNADWLCGRYVSANWDFEQVNKSWKEKIVESNGLISKLSVPT